MLNLTEIILMDERIYYVYRHINKVNGKQYIGITKQWPSCRWGNNGCNYQESTRFWNAIQKYGWDNFEHEILFSGLLKAEACKIEKELISMYRTQDREFGYNILEGGDAPILTEEVKSKIANALKGNKNGLGHPCSDEKRKKISDAQKGRKLTEEHKRKLSIAKKGKSHGRPSEETIRKISQSHKKKKVYCIEQDIVYESIQMCAKMIGAPATSVCACCKGKVKTVKGYHLVYYDDVVNKSLTTIRKE